MNIANQGFPATRADINNALQAIATNNSGTSEPSTTFANQWFYNTNTNKLFIRNEANNAFIEVATLDQTNNEWQITTGTIQAKDSDGLALKTDDGNTRLFINDSDGNVGIGTTDVNGGKLVVGETVSGDTSLIQLLRTGVTERTNFIGLGGSNKVVIAADENNEGTDSNIRFKVGGSESMVIKDQNVGIGRTAPATKLHLQHDTSGESCELRIQNAHASSGAEATLNIQANGNNFSIVNFPDADTSNANRTSFKSTAGSAFFTFDPGGSTGIMTLNSANIGFGTTDPDSFAPSNISGGREVVNAASGGGTFIAARNDNSIAAGDKIGGYLLRTNDSAGVKFGGMTGVADDTSGGFNLDFFAGRSTSDDADEEGHMQLDDAGDLYIRTGGIRCGRSHSLAHTSVEESVIIYQQGSGSGDTATSITARNGTAGDNVFRHQRQGSIKSEIEENGDFLSATGSYGSISDERLKENIADAASQWDDIKAVKVKKYSFKEDELDAPNMIGVMAQDLQAAGMNGLVTKNLKTDLDDNPILDTDGNQEEFFSVKYSILYMKAIKALQEAMAKIETLETEMTSVKSRLDALEG